VAIIDTRISLSAPTEINVTLVRADYSSTSNVFRIMFELFLAISSALMSVNLSIVVTKLHWIFFGVTFFSSILFLGLSLSFAKRAKVGK
jgi:hypothetical protein